MLLNRIFFNYLFVGIVLDADSITFLLLEEFNLLIKLAFIQAYSILLEDSIAY